MAEVVQNFLHKFHSLEGITVDDKKRNLFLLLRNSKHLLGTNAELLDEISRNLNPKTYLESLLKLDFLIYFRRTQELFHILKESNDMFVGKILKQDWFFKEQFEDMEAQHLVNEVLPEMSFSVRVKVLGKLSKLFSSEKFDEIFDKVNARYGLSVSTRFITGCSSKKVREILTNYPKQLTPTQLRILHEKDPDLIVCYFKNLPSDISRYIHRRAYRKFSNYLASKDPTLFCVLKKEYDFGQNFGRRITKKFLVSNKSEIVKNPNDFKHLNMKAVARTLGAEMVQLYTNSLAEKFGENVNKDPLGLERVLPKKYLYNMLVTAFQSHFNVKYADYPSLITTNLLDVFSNNEERSVLARIKVDGGNDYFKDYLRIEESFPLLFQQIDSAPNDRMIGLYFASLVQSCQINKDFNALFQLIRHFYQHYRNEDHSIILLFIQSIERCFGYREFTEEIWDLINKLTAIYAEKFGDVISYRTEILPTVRHKLSYLEFLFNKGEPIDELIDEFFTKYFDFPKRKQHSHTFRKYFMTYTVTNLSKKYYDRFRFNIRLVEQIIAWNRIEKSDQISLNDFPELVTSFQSALKNDYISTWTPIYKIFIKKILTHKETSERDVYLKIYWDRLDTFFDFPNIMWFLKHQPTTVLDHFDPVFRLLIRKKTPFRVWYVLKKYSHLQLDERCTQLCLSKFSDESCLDQKPKLVPCLSVLMNPCDYAALADSYKPANKSLDLNDTSEVRLYNLQCALAQNFKNTKSHEVIPSLFNYCAGDYLFYSKNSLYSILHKTPENLLPQHLNYLSKKAVSVRKHALFMTAELCTYARMENMIKRFKKFEKSQSIQKQLFATTLKYFRKNQTETFFELVKSNMHLINKADKESLEAIITFFDKVPEKYQIEYLEFSWRYFEKIVDVWDKLSELKNDLLYKINDTTGRTQISLEFAKKIIRDHFMTGRDLYDLDKFILYLLADREEKGEIYELLFNILDNSEDTEVLKFLQRWQTTCMWSKSSGVQHLRPYLDYYEKRISIKENFSHFVKIFLLKVKFNSTDVPDFEAFIKTIVTFYRDVVSEYGPHVTELVVKEINENLRHFTGTHSYYDFYYTLLKDHPDVAALVVEGIFQPNYASSDADRKTFEKTSELIKSLDVGLQIFWKYKFDPPMVIENPFKNEEERMETG